MLKQVSDGFAVVLVQCVCVCVCVWETGMWGKWGQGVCFDTLIQQPSPALCGDLSCGGERDGKSEIE